MKREVTLFLVSFSKVAFFEEELEKKFKVIIEEYFYFNDMKVVSGKGLCGGRGDREWRGREWRVGVR